MRARDVMSTSLVTVNPDTTAKEAAELLMANGITTLPVIGIDGSLAGIVTDLDLIRDRISVDPRSLVHTDWPVQPVNGSPPPTVAATMTTEVIVHGPNTDAAQLACDMLDRHLRAIPIVDGEKLVGIVTRHDLLRTIARDDKTIAQDVRHHLERGFRRGDWSATVTDGVVTLVDEYGDETDRHIATVIANAIPGVVDVKITAP
jgi:CBS-domain-containing membrane protein